MQVFTTTSHSLIPQEAVYQKSLRCEVEKVVKLKGEIGGEMYAAKLPAAKNAGFFNNVPLIDTPRSSTPKIVEVGGRESGQI